MRPAAGPVEKGDLAQMLLDDLLDDREAEAGAAHAGRHIGLGQPLAVLGEADAGVEHVDDELPVLVVQLQLDAIAGEAMLAAIASAFDRLDAILDDIGQRLGELAAIADHAEFAVGRVEREA